VPIVVTASQTPRAIPRRRPRSTRWLAPAAAKLVETCSEANAAMLCGVPFAGAASRRTRRVEVERARRPEIRRLTTVPAVNLICAATFIAAVGDPRRFRGSRKLVAYLGLDPKVRQSGDAPARSGRISKRGAATACCALVEAAWSVVLQPRPLHAFYDRTRPRRGHGKAIVATARASWRSCSGACLPEARTTPTSRPR
jgi:transposase